MVFKHFKILILVWLVEFPMQIYAQWSTDPSNNLIVGYGLLPELCSDSAGGCYITYEQNLSYPRRLILERLDKYGYKPWGSGKRITGEFAEQCGAKIVEDGQNGVIITYLDAQETGIYNRITRLRVQKVDSSGNFLWGSNGVRVSLSETNQYDEEIASDGNNGCFVAWYDTTNILRVQRINNLGQRMLGDSGIYVDASNSNDVQIVSDEIGECFLYVNDAGGARLHKINFIGNKLWESSGKMIDAWASPKFISDGQGGILYGGMKGISYNNGDPYYSARCQHIDSLGILLWGSEGITLDDSIQNNVLNAPRISLFRFSSGIIVFEWFKRAGIDSLNTFTQRMKYDGNFVFKYGGVAVSTIPAKFKVGGQWIMNSSISNSIHIWSDNRSPSGIYTQMIDSTGQRVWGQNDVAICLQSIGGLRVLSDGNGGVIVIGWRETDFTIRAQQISLNGNLGEIITIVEGKRNEIPSDFILYQNYPNPFNSSTIISYDLPKNSHVYLSVYNLLGQEVNVLVDKFEYSGEHQVLFDAESFSSGVYYYKLVTDIITKINKLTILK
ncbi:MAG: hypothetical protein C0417_11365 [Chlorobiaceae bacterium]|nr:hypothetical protein [Chlorobiaceae bacterium]